MKTIIFTSKKIVSIILSLAVVLTCFSMISLTALATSESDHPVISPAVSDIKLAWEGWTAINTKEVEGGVNVDFTDGSGMHATGYRVFYNKDLNLDGLYLDFSGFSTDASSAFKGMAVSFGEDDYSLRFQFDFDNNGYTNQIRYRIGNNGDDPGTLLYLSEALSYSNFANKPFYMYFEVGENGDLYVTINVNNGETILAGGYIPAEELNNINISNTKMYIGNGYSLVSAYNVNFLGYCTKAYAAGSNFGYKINPVSSSNWINQYWNESVMSVTDLSNGGVNLSFSDNGGMYMEGYRWLLDKSLSLDELYLEMGGYNSAEGWPAAFGLSFDDGSKDIGGLWLRFNTNNLDGKNKSVEYTNQDGSISGELYTEINELWVESLPNFKFYVYTYLDDDGNLHVDLGFDNGTVKTGAYIPAAVLEQCGIDTSNTRLRVSSANPMGFGGQQSFDVDFYGYYQGKERIPSAIDVYRGIDNLGTVTADSEREVKAILKAYQEMSDAQKALIPDSYISKYVAAESALTAAIRAEDASLIKLSANDMKLRPSGENANVPDWADFLKLTDLPDGGVNVSFINAIASPNGIVNRIEQDFDLESLMLQFDNLVITDKTVPFEFILYNAFTEEYSGDHAGQYEIGTPNGVTFDIDTLTGTLSVQGYPAEYVQSDILKYDSITGGRFSIKFSEFGTNDEYNFKIEIKVGKETVSWQVPYEATDGWAYFDNTQTSNCYIAFNPSIAGNTESFDIIGYKYSGFNSGINNSDLMPQYIPVTETEVDENGTPTWADDLIIAELNAVKVGGGISALYPVLEHLEEAGINALWLCPIFDTENSDKMDVGYSNLGIHTINPAITGTADYEEGWKIFADFVETAHKHNIRVILDVVTWGCVNTSELEKVEGYSSSWVRKNGSADEYLFNWDNDSFVNWFVSEMVNLAERTNCDGFRYDCGSEFSGIDVLADVNTALQEKGRNLFMMSESADSRYANDGSVAFDTDQKTLVLDDMDGRDYLTYISCNPFVNDVNFTKEDGSVYTSENLSLVDTVKNGINLNSNGVYKYYTMCLSNHDVSGTVFKGNELAIAYQALFSPFIPAWYFGEEIGWELEEDGILYYQDISSWKSIASENAEYYEAVKQMIRIRRTYKQIFSNFSGKITDSNICKIEQTNTDISLETYARYAENKAIIVVPNENTTEKVATLSIASAFENMGLNSCGSFVLRNAITGEIIKDTTVASDLNNVDVNVAANSVAVISVDSVPYDINNDSVFNAIDLVVLRRYLLNSNTNDYNASYDVKADGEVNIIDLVRLKKMLVQIGPTTTLPLSEKNVELYGRFLENDNGYQFDWSGSAIEAGFNGTSAELQLKLVGGATTDYFNVYIDGGEPTMLTVTNTQSSYTLANNLPDGYHYVRLEKRTEGSQGALCEFVKFNFPNGKAAPAPARKARTIEFIGDSITAAYGNMAANSWNGFKLIEEDFANGYAALTANNLNANATVLGWSGNGMYQDLGGNKDAVFSNELFWRTIAHNNNKDWNFEQKPDVLVINLGTNDFASGCDATQYSECYAQFLRTVRELYPDTHIVCTIGIIGVGYNAVDYINNAITGSGIENVSFYEINVTNDELSDSEMWGGDGHPSAKAHAIMADKLSAHIAEQMGW